MGHEVVGVVGNSGVVWMGAGDGMCMGSGGVVMGMKWSRHNDAMNWNDPFYPEQPLVEFLKEEGKGMAVDEQVELVAGRELDALVAEKVMGHNLCPVHHSYFCCNQRRGGYSTDIAAAWEVVEKLGKGGELLFTLDQHRDDWEVTVYDPKTSHKARCKAAPEAICRAALKAVGHVR